VLFIVFNSKKKKHRIHCGDTERMTDFLEENIPGVKQSVMIRVIKVLYYSYMGLGPPHI
jgi:hypothetical protein